MKERTKIIDSHHLDESKDVHRNFKSLLAVYTRFGKWDSHLGEYLRFKVHATCLNALEAHGAIYTDTI
jgi:hypothetical protein